VTTLEELRVRPPACWRSSSAETRSRLADVASLARLFALAHIVVVARPGVAIAARAAELAAEWSRRLPDATALASAPAEVARGHRASDLRVGDSRAARARLRWHRGGARFASGRGFGLY
jgi:hypothetical protein